jgi:penicillin-binding protein 1A
VNLGYQYAESFGFTSLCDGDKNLGLCLGGLTNGVSNLELTAAYATIANGGEYMEPKFYTVVYDHDGNVLLDRSFTQETHRVIKETTAWLLTSAMEDVMTSGTGTRAYFGSTMAQAGKSGTTTGNRDALFAGYTPYYTLVVWGGFDDNSIQAKGQTTYPKNIWKAVMSRIHENLEYKDFTQPSGIRTELVCKESGKRPLERVCEYDQRGSMVYSEFFDQNNMPESVCDRHVTVNLCAASRMIAGAFCPTDGITSVVYAKAAVDKLTGLEDSSSTNEAAYVITDEQLNNICTMHDESTVVTEPEEDTASENDGTGQSQTGGGQSNYIEDGEPDGITQAGEEPADRPQDEDNLQEEDDVELEDPEESDDSYDEPE